MHSCSLLLAFGVLCVSAQPVFADGVGTPVTGSLTFNGGSTNYFDPANAFVPAGFGNASSTTVTIGSGTEFGFKDGINTDTADFTGSLLTITDVSLGGSAPFSMIFTDPAFTSFSLLSNGLGLTSTFSGHSFMVNFPGTLAAGTNSSSFSYTASAAVTPEPGSFVLLGTGVLAAAGALRRRFLA